MSDDPKNSSPPLEEVIVPKAQTAIPSAAELSALRSIAETCQAAGMGPANVIMVKLLTGREIGLAPIASVKGIDIIPTESGARPAINSATRVGLVRRNGWGDVKIISTDKKGAKVLAIRDDQQIEFSFTEDDAAAADLLKKRNYRMWPAQMYLARAQSMATNAVWQDKFLGPIYSPDELGAETDEFGRLLTFTPSTSSLKAKSPDAPTDQPAPAATEEMGTSPPTWLVTASVVSPQRATPTQYEEIRNQIKRLMIAAACFGANAEDWARYKASFLRTAPSAQPAYEQYQSLRLHLINLFWIWKACTELDIPPEKLAAALAKRGVNRIASLEQSGADDLYNRLKEQIQPFVISRITKEIIAIAECHPATELAEKKD